MGFVPAVVAVGEVLGLCGFEVAQDLVGVEASSEMLVQLLAFLIFQGSHNAVVVGTLNQHSFIRNASEFVVDLKLRSVYFVIGKLELDGLDFL